MTLSTWQLIVVGALAAVWAVVLGIPLLADLLRWLRNRPPASLSDERSLRDQIASAISQSWRTRPRPVRSWRSQAVAQKRLQILLGTGVASVVAMFLAIAFRGPFVVVFALALGLLVLMVLVGAVIGAREQRQHSFEAHPSRQGHPNVTARLDRTIQRATLLDGDGRPLIGSDFDLALDGAPTANPWQDPDGEFTIPTIAEISEAFEAPDRDGFMFPPLNLDEALLGVDQSGVVVPQTDIEVPVDPDLVAELGLDLDAIEEPRFEAAPEVGLRQASARVRRKKRQRSRPIYIESALDEQDDQGRAIND